MQLVHECDMCGGCCQKMDGIAYCIADAERMAKHLNTSKTKWMREMTVPSTRKAGDRWLKLQGEEQKCPYLTEHGCSQYPGRGQVCRRYPWSSADQITPVREGKGFKLFPKCLGMLKTYIKYLEASFGMTPETANSILNSNLKKITYLKYIEDEGRGEAAKYAAKELGLEDIPEEENLKNMAQAYVIATLSIAPAQVRNDTLKQLHEILETRLNE
jgi:Fe-S-cluster containining protein